MRENLDRTRGLVFSEALLLELVKKGAPREEAYAWVQAAAMKVWESDQDFKPLVLADKNITAKLSKEEIEAVFDLKRQLRHVDDIFARVFPG
jgi:adenylosuccinate lyase